MQEKNKMGWTHVSYSQNKPTQLPKVFVRSAKAQVEPDWDTKSK